MNTQKKCEKSDVACVDKFEEVFFLFFNQKLKMIKTFLVLKAEKRGCEQ